MKLTAKQAAARAGVSPGLVYAWCEARRLPHYRMPGRGRRGKLLIDADELDAFLAASRVEAQEETPIRRPIRRFRAGGVFGNLDSDRLRAAWRKEGAIRDDES
jgi:excisionase family DNA binding protein